MRGARRQQGVHASSGGDRAPATWGADVSPAGTQADEEPEPGREPGSCGWFESSHTLREGAEVHEHEVLDAIVNDLPLAWWIEWAGLRADAHRD